MCLIFSENPFNPEQSITHRFERIAALHPSQIALTSGDKSLSYAELNSAANRVAHKLLSHHGALSDRVAVLMRHDSPLIAAVLGILKTPMIVVVLNPTDPSVRLRQVIDDAEPVSIITDSFNGAVANQIVKPGCRIIFFEEHSAESDHNPEIQISPEQTAFLVYTSGSTGPPKGVMKTHRCVQHNAYRLTCGLELHARDQIILLASLSGGQGIATMSCALLNGATLYPFPIMDRGVNGLADLLMKHHITVFISAVSVFRHFTRTLNDKTLFPDVKVVQFASETATVNDFAAWQKHFSGKCFLLHTLSSSETGTIIQQRFNHHEVISDGPLPIGRAMPDVQITLCDENGYEVRDGETGEIIVKSAYISPGYWRNDPLTAERFSQSDDDREPKVFRGGDLGRRNSNGQITFVGRKGDRVKIRGYRIETSEIERVLLRQPEVEKAIVGLRESSDYDPQLAAYIVLRSGLKCTVEKLRHALRSTLPSQMVPAFFVFLDKFPLTPHGKVDRESLRRIDPPMTQQIQKPATEMEKLLADIWSEVFHRSMIGRNGHFFDLGGDSLTAAVIAARISAAINVEMDLRLFTDHPILADLAKAIEGLRHFDRVDHLPRLTRASREALLPVSFAQERILKHSQALDVPTAYTMASSNFVKGDLNVEILQESLNHLLGRHEILRTTFDYIGGKPVQIVHPTQTLPLHLLDLTAAPKEKKNILEILQKESRRAFDLKQEPLVRMILVRTLRDEHYLLRISNHIISDAWSWQVFFQELAQVYEAKLRGDPSPVPEFEPLQYGDFAVWQRNVLNPDGEIYKNEVLWWKKLFAKKMRQFTLPFIWSKKLQTADSTESTIWWGLDPAISQKLNHIGFEQNVTYYAIRLAAFAALLAQKTGQPDLAIGTYITNRNQVETHKIFGHFANPAVLQLHCDMNQTFLDWLGVVRKIVSEAHANSKIPYEQLCDELRKQGVNPPEILAIFSVSTHTTPISLGDAVMTWNDRWIQGMPWGFTLAFDQFNEAHGCRASFDTRLYDPLLVRAFIEQYVQFLDTASCNPNLPIAELLAISKPEPKPRENNNIYSKILGKFSLGLLESLDRSAQIVEIRGRHVTQQDGVDRKNPLRIDPPTSEQVQKPVTETETLLANIWSDVLGRSSVGRNDHFFDLGGDSVSATVITARIHAALNVEMDLRLFTDYPILADLAETIDNLPHSDCTEDLPSLNRASRKAHLPISFAQERILMHSEVAGVSAGFTVACNHRIHGPLNIGILRETIDYLLQRHEILRTTFDYVDGKPVQIVHSRKTMPLPVIDLAGAPDAEKQAAEILRKEAQQPFDLKQGPLLRFFLIRISEDEHRFLRVDHHIISDGWSWRMYFKELASIYEAKLRGESPKLPAFEPLQYGDFAAWERNILNAESSVYKNEVQWWKNLFADNMPATVLPFKRSRTRNNADPAEGSIWWGLDPVISQRLAQIGRKQKVTYYEIRLAAFVALLAQKMGQAYVTIGTYVTNRDRVETQKIFGFLANPAALRFHCDMEQTFLNWLGIVRKTVNEMRTHCRIPYELLCDELRKQGVNPPEILAIFSVSVHTAPIHMDGAELTWNSRLLEAMPWGFTLAFDQHNETNLCRTSFDARIYDPALVRKFIEQYKNFLDVISQNPNLTLAELLALSNPKPKPKQKNRVYSKILRKFSLGLSEPLDRSAPIAKIRDQHVAQQDGVDQKNLPLVDSSTSEQVQKPLTETETLLANIWSEVLGRPSIGRNDHFFNLGGDSLRATVIAARIHAAINVQMDLRVFTDHPTLADLAGIIDSLHDSGRMDDLPRLSRILRDAHLPISFAQERVLKYSQTAEASARQTIATSLHIHGPLNIDILHESMNYIVQRHEILRTTFDNIDCKPVQIAHPFQPEPLPVFDLSGMSDAENRAIELLQKEAMVRFDLARGPLLRFLLVRIREDEHRLLNINHHIISDGWSWKVYFHELGLIYEARLRGENPPLPEFEPLQYADYAAWERRVLDPAGTAHKQKVRWWKNLFSDNPRSTVLPFKRRKSIDNADSSQGFMFWGLNASISQRLERLGCEQSATYFVMRLSAFVALLAAETRQPDVIIGINVSNRHDLESQKMFGFFANMAMLRLNCKPTQTFLEWVHVVRKMVGEVQARSDIPYEQLCDELRKQGVHPPKISALFNESIHTAPIRFGGLVLTWHERCLAGMPWGFIMTLDQYNENCRCRTTFDAGIYNPDLVRAFTEKYVRLLDAVSYNPNLTIAELLAISKPEPEPKQNNNVYKKILDKLLPKKSGISRA